MCEGGEVGEIGSGWGSVMESILGAGVSAGAMGAAFSVIYAGGSARAAMAALEAYEVRLALPEFPLRDLLRLSERVA